MKIFTILLLILATGLTQAEEAGKTAPVVIDVRSQEEWDEGHVESAILIPHNQIGKQITKRVPDKATPILLYCRSGGRAGRAMTLLKKMGYTDVTNLGGLDDARAHLKK